MRKIYFLLLTVFSFLTISQNSFSQTVTIGTGASVQLFPLNYYYGYGRSSMIYTAAEMGITAAGASVLSIAFECNTALNTGPTIIYLQETGTTTTQTGTTWASKISGATIVYNGTPAVGVAGWRTITLTTPFPLSANQNLEVMVECNFGGTGTLPSTGNNIRYSTVTAAHQYWQQDNSAPTGNGTVTANRPNIQIVLGPPIVCVAPPTGGTTQSSSASVCPGGNFTLSVTGASFGTGLTYQWESSMDGSTWTPIAGATSQSLITSQTIPTYFRRKITCSSTDAWSSSLQVTMNAPTNCYCACAAGGTSFEYIGGIVFTRGINNTGTNHGTYTNYAATQISSLYQGQSVTLTISSGGTWYPTDFAYVFIDYNQDGDFNDAGELVGNSSGNTSPYTINFNISATAVTGTTRMRIKFGDTEVSASVPMNNSPCQTGYSYGETEDYGLNITTPPPCVPPTELTASSLTQTTATLNWTASATASNGYQWEVRTSGVGGSGAAGLAASGNTAAGITTANATGLTANTSYNLYVRSNCGSSIFSTWADPFSFTTLCNATNVPFIQNFDAVSTPNYPSCLILQDLNGATTWKMYYFGGVATSSPPNSIRYEWNATTPADDWFFIQGLNLTGGKSYTLSFKYKGSDGPDFIEKLEVKYGTAPNASAMTSGTLFTNTNITSSVTSPFAEPSVSFTPAVTGVYYIGFHAFSDIDQAFLYIDDIEVQSCPKPTNVSAVGISTTSALVSFTSPGTSFVVEYGPPGFVPGTTSAAGGGTVVLSASSPVTISGLTVNTAYDFYVRQICIPGVEYSSNVKAEATTLCAATGVPYLQTFESATVPAMPPCTSVQDINGNSGSFWNLNAGGLWETFSSTTLPTYVSPNKSLIYSFDPNNTARGGDDWFFTQGLNLTAGQSYRLKFFYKGTFAVEKLEVKYGTIAYDEGMTSGTLYTNDNVASALSNPFDSARIDFTPATSGVYYIGFHSISDADQAYLLIDDISVKATPAIDVGITGIVTPSLACPTNGVIVQTTMRNYNLYAIDFSVNPITVTANITGTSTAALNATINSGTLAAGASMDLYLNPSFDFAAGTYNITVATSSPDDSEPVNDSYTTLIKVNPIPVAPVITPVASQVCIGGTVQLSTQFISPPPPPVNHPDVSSGAISLTIPDNNPAGISHTLSVSGIPVNATITGVSVTINATHTWNSDLIFNLKAPNGNILNLVNRKGGSGDGFTDAIISSASGNPLPSANTTPVTGTFAANASNGVGPMGYVSNVTAFTGLYSIGNGGWTLAIRDVAGGDIGTLTSWSITISYQVLHPVVTWSPVIGLFTNAAATTAYTGEDAYSIYAKPDATTTYTVTATGPGGCTSTGTATVTVNPYPVITIGAIPDTVCISDQLVPLEATPVGGSWSGTGVSGTNFVPPVTAVGTYTLTYRYTNDFGCTSTATKKISVKDCPERIILLRDNAVMLYPNPNNGQFNIRINSVLYNYLGMKVFTNDGVLVRTQEFGGLAYGRVIPIDISNLPGGVYMVKFYYDGGVRTSEKTFKVIIAH